LAARQAADIAEKQEREKKLAEGKPAEAKAPAAPPAGDTTLHKPKVAPGVEKKGARRRRKSGLEDEGVKRRTIKTRGDVQGASGWHTQGKTQDRGRAGRGKRATVQRVRRAGRARGHGAGDHHRR